MFFPCENEVNPNFFNVLCIVSVLTLLFFANVDNSKARFALTFLLGPLKNQVLEICHFSAYKQLIDLRRSHQNAYKSGQEYFSILIMAL